MEKITEDNFSLKRIINHAKGNARLVAHKTGLAKPAQMAAKSKIGGKLISVNRKALHKDHFNFAGLIDTVNKVSDTVQKVGTAVNTATQTYQQVQQTIKPTSNGGYLPVQNPSPYINNGYNTNIQSSASVPKQSNSGSLNSMFNGNPLFMIIGAAVVFLIITMVMRKG